MSKLVQICRHHKSIKNEDGEKIPTPEGVEQSKREGYEASQEYQGAEARGYHSSALRTEMAIDAYLESYGSGSKERLDALESVSCEEMVKLRKELGDDESNRIRLERYDKPAQAGESDEVRVYYSTLHERGKSIADKVVEEIENNSQGNEVVVAYGHEPLLSVSLIELGKKYFGHDGENNAEYFKELSGSDVHYFREGTGYRVEMEGSKADLVTKAGRFELKAGDGNEARPD